ncbi:MULTISPECIES: redoxin domain-containing protein [Hymenobacter]|uniref:Redoxin domain-containing protein n=1 Tax=Hymenobacter jejuensis TaxID=2502781 RepID=A0A5B8A4B8_9BACT|nr:MULTISPECIES: redoxin domain-containing protein [Hymenobacter]MBC6990605.1 redoxin domain-containing protein [Hymenobacter sp. BT491]QDA60982.1 redoxin domain-containing protein [Hymenobacter jejuensis]
MSFRRISVVAAIALLFCTVAIGTARAQGSRTVSDFSLKSVTNAEVALRSYASKKAVVVVFINQNCAFTKLYQGRLNTLASEYGGQGVQFLFIDTPINLESSSEPTDSKAITIKTSGDNLGYFTDEGQKVSTLLGATKTPEVVLLQPAGDGFAVRYKGAIDDNAQVESYVKERYLAQALDNVLAGRPVGVTDKRAAGCLIKRN